MRNKKLIILFSIICSITLIIIVSSVIFSVQNVYENCLNADSSQIYEGDTTLGAKVLSSHGIKKGKSIFILNKEDVIKNLESNVPQIRVTGIEKRFPNKVYIHYEKLYEYLQVYSGGKYYILSDDCRIIRTTEESPGTGNIIRLYVSGDIGRPSPGDRLASTHPAESRLAYLMISALENYLQYNSAVVAQFAEFIDIRNEHGFVYIKTGTGVYFKLLGHENIYEKLWSALSLYDKEGAKYKYEGTITVDNNLKTTHSLTVDYPYL